MTTPNNAMNLVRLPFRLAKRATAPVADFVERHLGDEIQQIVSRNYRLVTNKKALQMADQCCRTVFPETNAGNGKSRQLMPPELPGIVLLTLFTIQPHSISAGIRH
ncbi:MAG: hypothetical protein HQM09_08535 [Candidatus Riflebacteria bacterium]|nr:hypothetical protein [Candidatus Riflebacteria bacterium]